MCEFLFSFRAEHRIRRQRRQSLSSIGLRSWVYLSELRMLVSFFLRTSKSSQEHRFCNLKIYLRPSAVRIGYLDLFGLFCFDVAWGRKFSSFFSATPLKNI
jgi:hypothetical protein